MPTCYYYIAIYGSIVVDGTIWNTMTVITTRGIHQLSKGCSGSSKCLVTLLAVEVVMLVDHV